MTFLKLTQPIGGAMLPVPRIAEKGKKYTLPFTFVVPERLLPTTCSHRVKNDAVREEHLMLPQSAGDPSLASDRGSLVDDLFPDMTRISYYIQVRLIRRRESDGKAITFGDSLRRVRIIPIVEDVPPVHVDDHPGDYVLCAEKDIRKGLFKGNWRKCNVSTKLLSTPRIVSELSTNTCVFEPTRGQLLQMLLDRFSIML